MNPDAVQDGEPRIRDASEPQRSRARRALRAFEVAARRKSLAKAVEEISVTSAAVHHQVKSLESLLGVNPVI
jgi:LysR family glycine cleavage system transcriptional activator